MGALRSSLRGGLSRTLIVLDLMLPEIDGFEVCRILRKEMITPILMLTARDDEIDRVVGSGGWRRRLPDQTFLHA